MTCASDLFTLLESETQALTQRNPDALNRLIVEKQKKLLQLKELESTLKSILNTNDHAIDVEDMSRCIRELNSEDIGRMWKEFLNQIDKLQKQNRINGNLVNLTQRYVENTLHILQGEIPEDKLYDPAGQEINNRLSRSIAKT